MISNKQNLDKQNVILVSLLVIFYSLASILMNSTNFFTLALLSCFFIPALIFLDFVHHIVGKEFIQKIEKKYIHKKFKINPIESIVKQRKNQYYKEVSFIYKKRNYKIDVPMEVNENNLNVNPFIPKHIYSHKNDPMFVRILEGTFFEKSSRKKVNNYYEELGKDFEFELLSSN